MRKEKQSWWSMVGVVVLALLLPGILKLTNSVVRMVVGAEGRLAAIVVDTSQPMGELPTPWRSLAQGGDRLEDFLDDTESEIMAINPEYIRIDHIYDGLGTVSREGGVLKFDWSRLDKIIDKITEVGAKPFLALSYMPLAISRSDTVDEPKDWNDWAIVVQRTVEHVSGERGIEGVYYEVWNEPDLFGKWKMGRDKDYRKLYQLAAYGAGRAENVKDFKLGGPATTGLYKNWVDEFLPYVLRNNLRLDFFSWHRYDPDTNKFAKDIADMERWRESHPNFSRMELVISEMGMLNQAGGGNDEKTGAAHLVAVARELLYKVKYGFTFAVSGQWGIVGKPRYDALNFLGSLGGQRLAVAGEGSWVKAIAAKKNNTFQVLVVNYDATGVHNEVVPVTFNNLKGGSFELKKTILGGYKPWLEEVATAAAMLQTDIPLLANSVALIELTPKP